MFSSKMILQSNFIFEKLIAMRADVAIRHYMLCLNMHLNIDPGTMIFTLHTLPSSTSKTHHQTVNNF